MNTSGSRPAAANDGFIPKNKIPKQLPRPRPNIVRELPLILFFVLSVLFMEFSLKIINSTGISFSGFMYILLFDISYALVAYLVTRIFVKRASRFAAAIAITAFQELVFAFQCIIFSTFGYYYGMNMVADNVGDIAGDFADTTMRVIFRGVPIIMLLSVPLVLLIIFNRRIVRSIRVTRSTRVICAALAVLFFLIPRIMVSANSDGLGVTDSEYYTTCFQITETSSRFGVVTGMRLEFKYAVLGKPEEKLVAARPVPGLNSGDGAPDSGDAGEGGLPGEVVYEPNALDIDFAALAQSSDGTVAELSNYFASLAPSLKNEYTGLFEGKNLIFITAEAFSPYFISESLTPTLYKMMNSGIVFNNYYQPAWGVSTSDGEYSGLMGIVPEAGLNSMKASKANNLYFTLGNQFRRLGYLTRAYHNNTYTYYDRNLTHPNLGYSEFIGMDNGLESGVSDTWPQSDLQMMQATLDSYSSNQPFHIYYMSVSGHCLYSFSGNYIASKNKEAVAALPYSDTVKAYFACQLEFEYAMEYLMNELEVRGIADDTVIVINADHYPYGLDYDFEGNTRDYFSELVGHTVDTNFERHKNRLIVWCGSIDEPIIVDEPVYSLDILPTLSNLFGFRFDSRLFAGRDVFSDAEPLVLFRNYSWITDKGSYNSSTREFIPAEGASVGDDYVGYISSIVKQKVQMSAKLLDCDYYGALYNAGALG